MNEYTNPADALLKPFGKQLVMARVESLDFLKDDETGSPVLDAQQNPIPTGLLNIGFLDKGGSREKVPFVISVAGNTAFLGGLPELGTLCVVDFRQGNDPVIIGFLPPSLHGLVSGRQVLPNLVPGEILAQSSIPDFDAQAQENFFRGARVWLDRYGRIVLNAQDYEFIVGYLLSNEFTGNVTRLVDPITNNPIYMRERVKGVERRVDDVGNVFFSYPQKVTTEINGDNTSTISGVEDKTFRRGFVWRDGKGNSVELSDSGELIIALNAGSFRLTSQGNVTHESMANHNDVVSEDYGQTIGGAAQLIVGTKRTSQIGEGDVTTVVSGDSEEHMILGKKMIEALTGITLSTPPFIPIKIGSDGSAQPVPLGNVLLSLLTQIIAMITLLSTAPVATTPVPVVAAGPAIAALVTAFNTTMATLNSLKVFTE